MAVPFANITDLLNLTAADFECIEGGGEDASFDTQETIRKGDGTFLQEDARMERIDYTHKYHIKDSGATIPSIGKVTGASSTVYVIDNVAVDKAENGHWSMTATFHRYADTSYTLTRSDLGLAS